LFKMASNALAARQQLGLVVDVDGSEFRRNHRPGRAGRDDFLSRCRCVELLGTSDAPIEDLRKSMEISRSQARDLIREARVRGLLTESTRGVKGGTLTSKGLQMLAQAEKET
jgi:hypothetical protein